MPPKKSAPETATQNDAAAVTTKEPPAPQPQLQGAAATRSREETPEGDVEEVKLDQNGNEIEEDKEGEITEQTKDLKKLDQYQQDILRLQHEKE